MTALETLLEKIQNHTEHHYKVLAGETHGVVKKLVKSKEKQDLYIKTLEDITHSYEIDPYHEDNHAIEKLEHLLEKIQKHLDSQSFIEKKENDSGTMYDTNLGEHRVYNIFTKAGKYRGGKIYDTDKHFVVLSGIAEITTHDGDEDIKTVVIPGQIVKIGAGTPHIFYFPEDTEILEWFPKDAKSKKYERFYKLKK